MPDAPSGETGAHSVRLDVPAVVESLEEVHAAVERLWAADPSTGLRDRIRFETAVIEIAGNIVEHAYRLDEPASAGRRRMEVTLTIDPERVRAVLGDDGLPAAIDLSRVVMPDDEEAESGRGLALAVAALDDLDYRRDGDRNTWSLVCLRRPD